MDASLHRGDIRPMFGSSQPAFGSITRLGCLPMGSPREHKLVGVMRAVFAENLQTLLVARYKSARNDTDRRREFAKASGIAKESVRRWLRGEVSPNLDQIELVAKTFTVPPYELLTPGLGAGGSPPIHPTKPAGLKKRRAGSPPPFIERRLGQDRRAG